MSAHPKWQAELYPLYDGFSRWILPDGSLSRIPYKYTSKRLATLASNKFRKTRYAGMLMDHELFVDKLETRL